MRGREDARTHSFQDEYFSGQSKVWDNAPAAINPGGVTVATLNQFPTGLESRRNESSVSFIDILLE